MGDYTQPSAQAPTTKAAGQRTWVTNLSSTIILVTTLLLWIADRISLNTLMYQNTIHSLVTLFIDMILDLPDIHKVNLGEVIALHLITVSFASYFYTSAGGLLYTENPWLRNIALQFTWVTIRNSTGWMLAGTIRSIVRTNAFWTVLTIWVAPAIYKIVFLFTYERQSWHTVAYRNAKFEQELVEILFHVDDGRRQIQVGYEQYQDENSYRIVTNLQPLEMRRKAVHKALYWAEKSRLSPGSDRKMYGRITMDLCTIANYSSPPTRVRHSHRFRFGDVLLRQVSRT